MDFAFPTYSRQADGTGPVLGNAWKICEINTVRAPGSGGVECPTRWQVTGPQALSTLQKNRKAYAAPQRPGLPGTTLMWQGHAQLQHIELVPSDLCCRQPAWADLQQQQTYSALYDIVVRASRARRCAREQKVKDVIMTVLCRKPVLTIQRNSWKHVSASQTFHSPKQLGLEPT